MSNYSRNPLLQLTSLLYTLCALGGNVREWELRGIRLKLFTGGKCLVHYNTQHIVTQAGSNFD